MEVSIKELQEDLVRRFTKHANGGDFGITKIDFPLESEVLTIYVEHFRETSITYKITFEKVLSYVVLQEFLQENSIYSTIDSRDFYSIILKQVEGTEYMKYLHESTDLNIFFEGDLNKKINQYCLYSQTVLVDVITDRVPKIEIIDN